MGTVSESAQRAGGPTVSVVVVSCNTPRTLEKCLASLSRQPAAEILVMDCSDRDPGVSLAARFPGVRFRHFDGPCSIPRLRAEGIRVSQGEVVALIESWMEPCQDWVESLRAAHRDFPGAAVVGGPIDFDSGGGAGRIEWADYFSEYGEHVGRPTDSREVTRVERVSGANCSYKRWALEECRDLVEQAAWETPIHERLLALGHEIRRADAARVRYRRPGPVGEMLRRRFEHGRGHAAERLRRAPWVVRLARGAAAPLVPAVLVWRLWRGLPPAAGLRRPFVAALGWILALTAAWALGEAAGSWFGASQAARKAN